MTLTSIPSISSIKSMMSILLCLAVCSWAADAHAASFYTDPQAWDKSINGGAAGSRAEAQKRLPYFTFGGYDPALPNVLLIGDSISMGYTADTRIALKEKANVYRIPENGGDTARGLEKLDAWLAGEKWAVIHFNFGLHDLKHWKDNKMDMSAPVVATPEQYGKNLEALVKRLQATGAKLIFATTTPVPEGQIGRDPGAEAAYNEVALRIMQAHNVTVNDLCALVQPKLAEYQLPKNVHFTPAGSAAMGQQVAAAIEKALANKKPGKAGKKKSKKKNQG